MNPQTAPSNLPTSLKAARARKAESQGLEPLDVNCTIDSAQQLSDVLHSRIIGQDEPLDVLIGAFSRILADLRDPRRPALSLLLLGPTGVGKTETARALADTLFGDETAMTRINCEEYSHGHEVSKLLGAPPGYVGYGAEPLLSQRRIDLSHRRAVAARRGMIGEQTGPLGEIFEAGNGKCLSVILFDEVEKAHPALWNALLGVLEGEALTLGDNTTTDLTSSIVILTSNVGSHELSHLIERSTIGFSRSAEPRQAQPDDLEAAVLMAARETFPPEFLNRLDDVLVYSALERKDLELIFDKFLADLHQRAMSQAGFPLLVRVSSAAKRMIIARGTDPALGARPLRRAIDTHLVGPLSRLIASRSVTRGDVIRVERRGRRLAFFRDTDATAAVVA